MKRIYTSPEMITECFVTTDIITISLQNTGVNINYNQPVNTNPLPVIDADQQFSDNT